MSIHVAILDDSKQPDWDRFVARSPDVISWHAFDWSRVLRTHCAAEFYPIAAHDGRRICGILPLYGVRTRWSGYELISVPYFVAGGIVADDQETRQRILEKALEVSWQCHGAPLTLKQYGVPVEGPLQTETGYHNHELDLSLGLDASWAGIDERQKARVEEARRHPLELEEGSSSVDQFYRLLLRDHHRVGRPCVSRRWVDLLLSTGMYSVALLRRKGRVVCGTMVKRFKDTVSFPLTGVDGEGPEHIMYACYMYWTLIERVSRQGVRIVHSGRISSSHAAPAYRLGWGGEPRQYFYQYHGKVRAGERQKKSGWKRRAFEFGWRRLPESGVRRLGPRIVTQFP